MSKWSHVSGIIKVGDLEGLKKILSEQVFKKEPWKHFTNPYSSLSGSEGDAEFWSFNDEPNVLRIKGDLRDVGTIPEDKEQIIEDFKKLIEITNGNGYIEIKYEYEGTAVVDYYDGVLDFRVFPKADGWDRYYEWRDGT